MESFEQLDNPSYRLIADDDEARVVLDHLQAEEIVGLDTETYWDAAQNRSHVSLVQIAPRAGDVLVFDVLAMNVELLRPLVESPAIIMAAHNARFDEGMLLGAGLKPASFVDTLRMARAALRLPSYSLAGVSAHLFGIELDKSFQKSNWRRRPLTRGQLDYAAKDPLVTLRIYDELQRILATQGRLEEAMRAALLLPSTGEKRTATRHRRAPQPPPRALTDAEKRTVVLLKRWRLERARDERVPAYMICPDRTLEHLAMERPATLEALASIHGLGASKIARFGEALLDELKKAMSDE